MVWQRLFYIYIYSEILQKQEYLSTKCKGALSILSPSCYKLKWQIV